MRVIRRAPQCLARNAASLLRQLRGELPFLKEATEGICRRGADHGILGHPRLYSCILARSHCLVVVGAIASLFAERLVRVELLSVLDVDLFGKSVGGHRGVRSLLAHQASAHVDDGVASVEQVSQALATGHQTM